MSERAERKSKQKPLSPQHHPTTPEQEQQFEKNTDVFDLSKSYADLQSLKPKTILQLQRTIGNQAVQRLLTTSHIKAPAVRLSAQTHLTHSPALLMRSRMFAHNYAPADDAIVSPSPALQMRTAVQPLRVPQLIQRDIKGSKAVSGGVLEIDFAKFEGSAPGEEAGEKGSVRFTPGARSRSSKSRRYIHTVRKQEPDEKAASRSEPADDGLIKMGGALFDSFLKQSSQKAQGNAGAEAGAGKFSSGESAQGDARKGGEQAADYSGGGKAASKSETAADGQSKMGGSLFSSFLNQGSQKAHSKTEGSSGTLSSLLFGNSKQSAAQPEPESESGDEGPIKWIHGGMGYYYNPSNMKLPLKNAPGHGWIASLLFGKGGQGNMMKKEATVDSSGVKGVGKPESSAGEPSGGGKDAVFHDAPSACVPVVYEFESSVKGAEDDVCHGTVVWGFCVEPDPYGVPKVAGEYADFKTAAESTQKADSDSDDTSQNKGVSKA